VKQQAPLLPSVFLFFSGCSKGKAGWRLYSYLLLSSLSLLSQPHAQAGAPAGSAKNRLVYININSSNKLFFSLLTFRSLALSLKLSGVVLPLGVVFCHVGSTTLLARLEA